MTKKSIELWRRMVEPRADGGWRLRVFHRKKQGNKDPRYLIKCGCCDESLEISYGDEMLEINGVAGSVDNWREVLLPLLNIDPNSITEVAEEVARKL